MRHRHRDRIERFVILFKRYGISHSFHGGGNVGARYAEARRRAFGRRIDPVSYTHLGIVYPRLIRARGDKFHGGGRAEERGVVFIRARRRIISEVGFIRFGSGDYPCLLYTSRCV